MTKIIARIAQDTGVYALARTAQPRWIFHSSSFNAKMEEFARAVAEECARIVENELEDSSPLLAEEIRKAFGILTNGDENDG